MYGICIKIWSLNIINLKYIDIYIYIVYLFVIEYKLCLVCIYISNK